MPHINVDSYGVIVAYITVFLIEKDSAEYIRFVDELIDLSEYCI